MAIVGRLKNYLDKNGVDYHILYHQRVYTAQEVAAAQHVSGKELAKVVMIKVGSEPTMMVLPASFMVDMDKLKTLFHGKRVKLAREEEFQGLFPDCEIGAMPPFGNLYDMRVYADKSLSEDEKIAFNSGSHTELIQLSYNDFVGLVKPEIVTMTLS